ncbi:hypothetical protein MYG35_001188 [Escherichia coli]|nr:hypothetical protein [Escherichia coli]
MKWVLKALSGGAMLLGAAAFVVPVNALELEYKAPEPDRLQAPTAPRIPEESKSVPDDKWRESQRSEKKGGFRIETECEHQGCTRPLSLPRNNRFNAPVKKTDRLRQTDPYSTNQDPEYNIQMGYEW